MIVIGLTGAAGSGKDTAADYLVERYGFKKMAFADALKAMLDTLNPYVADDVRVMDVRRESRIDAEATLKKHFPEYRRLLQVLGTECVRSADPDFWVDRLVRKVHALGESRNIVVTDCRFPNEVEALESLLADAHTFWHVIRPSLPKSPGNVHSSESWAGRMGETPLLNDGDKPALYAEVDQLLDKLLTRG